MTSLTPGEVTSAELAKKRKLLAETFCDLPDKGSPILLQEQIAQELQDAEENQAQASPGILKRHKRLLRVIGDSFAFSLLHDHTIRTLGNHPGSPASLTGQAQDFEFVLSVARKISEAGYVPILCDITNLLKIGDIIAVHEQHTLVLECKQSQLPNRLPNTGRLARQRVRGTRAAEYLQKSQITEPGGLRQAIPYDAPTPRWEALSKLAQELPLDKGGHTFTMLGTRGRPGRSRRTWV
jgi:hypothetical protein